MKNNEFFKFLTEKENPPARLHEIVKKDILLSFHKKNIVLKFLAFQLLGAAFSLSVCPQFGLGLVDGHGIAHIFRMMGDLACASFCGALFLSSGMLVAFMGMKGEELWWIWRRYKISLIFLPAMLWGTLMLFNVSLNLPSETVSYHLTWIVAAMMFEAILFQIRSSSYLRILRA